MSCPAGILIQKPPQKYSRLSDHVCTYGENLWRMRLRWHWWWQLLTLQGIACVYSFCAFVSQAGLSHQLLHLDCKIQTFDIWDQPELRQLKRFVFQRSTVASYERVVVAFGAVSWVWICSQVCRCDRTHSRGGWISSQALFFFSIESIQRLKWQVENTCCLTGTTVFMRSDTDTGWVVL